ncbi:MAG TPA: hypothetical protein PK005_09080 [Bacteroidales bacterium]|jgi:hypothetical protein|nr:hypothetical protein [Bacteroidales bacterium]MDI9534068.1 hypothetical protein [Bacteroidota bacterium]OPZ57145.1 MAG: hypothetical protein BWY89_00855 [Bacteroidetes bacterium ADurb.BinA012]MBP7036902.1 hypothetical protein [Bacteroidales bacterium]MBP8708890.1 hypothetical protein [Bacteroidales bacterium]
MKRFLTIAIIVLLLVAAGIFWWRHYFVFGEGVKAGDLNFLVRKGYIFKTWEGKLIQTGFRTPTPGAMQSNEFEFSITNDSLATILERASGKFVELRYKEYIAPLPWRGMSKYVIIEILDIRDSEHEHQTLIPYQAI